MHRSLFSQSAFIVLMSLGAVLQAQVTANPAQYSFSSTAVGKKATTTINFTVSNVTLGGVSALTQGVPNMDYTVVATGTTCTVGTTRNCTVKIQFLPQLPGNRIGALVLSDQNGNTLVSVPLSGVGTSPLVAFGPGIMSTLMGGDVASTTVGMAYVNGVGVDALGNVYASDTYYSMVYQLSPAGVTTKIAGTGRNGYSGDGGPATAAELYYPTTIRFDGAGNLYIVDGGNNAVRMINPAGTITTVAGLAPGASICAQATDQWGDGCPATQASLDFADSYYGEGGTATDAAGNLYIGDTAHNLIRVVSATTGIISIFAGTGNQGYSGDGGPATSAQLNNPDGGGFDGAGNFYFADLYNNVIRKITPSGTISTVAGTGQYGHTGNGGLATSAELGYPYQVAVDAAGNLYITDSGNFTEGDTNEVIREVNASNGIINTVAGMAPSPNAQGVTYAGDGGPATSALMWGPVDIVLDALGNFYIADDYNAAVRKVDVSDEPPVVTFASIPYGTISAPQDVAIENIGNATLTIGQIIVGSNVSVKDSDTTCIPVPQQLAPGTSCILGIEFAPEAVGQLDSTVTVGDNSLNQHPKQVISVQGTGLQDQINMTLSSSPNPSKSGHSVKFTATLTSTGVLPKGQQVTFSYNGTQLGVGTISVSGSAVFLTTALPPGMDVVTASYAGDANFSTASAQTTQTVQ